MDYFAHIDNKTNNIDTDRKQTVKEHNENVANIAKKLSLNPNLKNTVYLSGLLHDIGKSYKYFQDYLQNQIYGDKTKSKKSHSTLGAKYINSKFHEDENTQDTFSKNLTSELISIAISSHHGLFDCINVDGENNFKTKMNYEYESEHIPQSYKELEDALKEQNLSEAKIGELFNNSVKEIRGILNNIKKFDEQNGNFYLGFLERLILSILIDADRIDTESFMYPEIKDRFDIKNNKKLFEDLLNNLNNNINKFRNDTNISKARRQISDTCFNFADRQTGVYRLNIPTGGGKTLSSLRYALNHAQQYDKQHIFYIAPFMSILEQNSSEIRKFVNNDDVVLEHHSNIVFDEDDEETLIEEKKYKLLTENWNVPIIATTLVQFLNTLFSHKTSCIRRLHSLTNSVIIIDEIQSLPIKCISLFNLACNFLSKICNTTIILCSATQPTIDEEKQCKIILNSPENIIDINELNEYLNIFKRTNIVDKTTSGGYSNEEISQFVINEIKNINSLMLIVNTKSIAEKIYNEVIKINQDNNIKIIHLSTNMCPAHRKETIKILKNSLEKKEKIICITTQLIEAGVDISFECVIRSLAGLDNIAQAAGRCNRNGEYNKIKQVYVINLKEENLNNLEEIKNAQNSTNQLLTKYKSFNKDLLDTNIIKDYYKYLFMQYDNSNYKRFIIKQLSRNILDLLSNNKISVENYKTKYYKNLTICLRQSFKTACENFKVIKEKSVNVIVYYDKNSNELISKLYSDISYFEKKKILKKIQSYVVSLNETQYRILQDNIRPIKDVGVNILDKEFYDKNIGVCLERKQMDILIS